MPIQQHSTKHALYLQSWPFNPSHNSLVFIYFTSLEEQYEAVIRALHPIDFVYMVFTIMPIQNTAQ